MSLWLVIHVKSQLLKIVVKILVIIITDMSFSYRM